jgi:hypothetical protein
MSKEREQYFQSIARRLFSLRGAPFYLSAREIEIIEAWESQGIPLGTAMEGLKQGYEAFRIRKAGRARKFSLLHCLSHVGRAFDLYQERGVGQRNNSLLPTDKYRQTQAAVKVFLKDLPHPLLSFGGLFHQALDLMSRESGSESRLEELDEKIEDLLFKMASDEDRKKLQREIQSQHGIMEPEELARLVRIQWIKSMRDRYAIPFLAPFYY